MLPFLKNPYSKILLGIIWGLGIACLIAHSLKNNIAIKAPEHEEIDGKIFGHENKCFKYENQNTKCMN